MKKVLLLSVLLLTSLLSFAAVKVGDTFTGTDGNTYSYRIVTFTGTDYYIEVSLVKCISTGNVTLPTSIIDSEGYTCKVTYIGQNVFTREAGPLVTGITIPETYDYISTYAFIDTKATSISIPKSITTIRNDIGSEYTQEYIVDPQNPNYCSVDGVIFTKDRKELVDYPGGKTGTEYHVPAGTESIRVQCFDHSHLTDIHIPQSVTTFTPMSSYDNVASLQNVHVDNANEIYFDIDGVFCKKAGNQLIMYPRGRTATSYTVPAPIEIIANNAFNSENDLTNVILGPTVKKLEQASFNFMGGLTSITLSAGVTDLTSGNPFRSCNRLANINIVPENKKYKSIDGVVFDIKGETLVTYPYNHGATYTIPEKTKVIAKGAFESVPITNVAFPTTLEKIEANAFQRTNITSVNLSSAENFTYIGKSAFAYCANLQTIQLSESTDTIESSCFYRTIITEFIAPDSLTYIGDNAFESCSNLTKVQLDKNIRNLRTSCFKDCVNLETFTIPAESNLTYLGGYAFQNDSKLKPILIPKGVPNIIADTFNGCSSLTTVYFEEGSALRIINTGAFQESGLQAISLPEGITEIRNNAFNKCDSLKTVQIPSTTRGIDPLAFSFCTSLTDINVVKSNQNFSSCDGYLLSKDKETLVIFPTGKARDSFTLLPPSITNIGHHSFYSCDKLTTVTIPKKVDTIELRAFYLCKNLQSIAFLGEPATTIGEDAFDNAKVDGYSDIKSRATIYVRKDDKAKYKTADFWKDFTNIETSFMDADEINEYLPMSQYTVNMLNSKADVHTYVVPSTVSNGTKTYAVGLIGDYAFEENTSSKLKELVMFDNVEYIGAKAFKQAGTQTIENLFFVQKEPTKQLLSTTRFELTPEDLPVRPDGKKDDQYKEFDDNMKIYVRKLAYEKCITDWAAYKDMISYKIKDAQVKSKYGTFSREFDVDLSECLNETNKGKKVLAFTAALTGIVEGGGDYGESEYRIKMESINCGAEGDGTYIPKNTGVLLKVMDADATDDDDNTFYTISDRNDDNLPGYDGANVMQAVTVDPQTITVPTESSIYVMQGGVFRYVNPTSTPTLNMPIHKAYLKLTGAKAGARVVFEEGDATGIEEIASETRNLEPETIYNLQGQRVNGNAKGIVIKNGKKMLVK